MSTGSGACLERLISEPINIDDGKENAPSSAFALDVEIPAGESERTPLHLAAAHGRQATFCVAQIFELH